MNKKTQSAARRKTLTPEGVPRQAEVISLAAYCDLRMTHHRPGLALHIVRCSPTFVAGAEGRHAARMEKRRAEGARGKRRAQIITFRRAVKPGMYELDPRGVVTHCDVSKLGADDITGRDFFGAVAPPGLRPAYAAFAGSDRAEYRAAWAGAEVEFVKVGRSVVAVVDAKGGAR